MPEPSAPQPPSISVVMPVFNGERFLAAAIESVLAQDMPPAQFVVVDDGSTDGSAALLHRYGDRIVLLSQPNGGQSLARRRGAELATGDLLAFIDQDDVWDANKLARQADLMQRYPEAVATYCDHRVIDDAGSLIAPTGSGYGLRGSGRILDALLRGNFIRSASLVMVRRSSYVTAGGFEPERCFWSDDYSLWMRLAAHGPFIYQAETLVSYRQHANNTSGDDYEKSRGDAHAISALVGHLDEARITTHVVQAVAAKKRALRAASWVCRKRGEYARALAYWLESTGWGG
jgi:glycosyltransferase involved in cell wall biosynthesis